MHNNKDLFKKEHFSLDLDTYCVYYKNKELFKNSASVNA